MRSFLAPALFVVAIGVALTSCGGGGKTSPSLREYAPANLMIEHSHITYVGCGDPYGPKHVYTCEFLTGKHKGTMGIAEVVITGGGKGYKLRRAIAAAANATHWNQLPTPAARLKARQGDSSTRKGAGRRPGDSQVEPPKIGRLQARQESARATAMIDLSVSAFEPAQDRAGPTAESRDPDY